MHRPITYKMATNAPYFMLAVVVGMSGGLSCALPREYLAQRGLDTSHQGEHFNITDTVTFECQNKTWTLTGPPFVNCLQHGSWDRDLPVCTCGSYSNKNKKTPKRNVS